MSFVLNRSLLNPKFDGYKLSPLDEERSTKAIALPGTGLSQSTVAASARLSFQEVQSRIKWNHLAVGCDREPTTSYATLAYIDRSGIFTTILIDKSSLETQFHAQFEIPAIVQTSTSEREYPSAISVSKDIWALSDGSGRIYVLQASPPPEPATLLSSSEIAFNNALVPCRLHSAILYDNYIVLLTSSRADTPRSSTAKPKISFDLVAWRIPISTSDQDPVQAELLWRKSGTDIPSFVNAQAGNFLICSGCTFIDPTPPSASNQTKVSEQTKVKNVETQPTTAPPPYSWTQTSESLTVAFPLPSNTPKSHIHVTIGPKHLSILIKDNLNEDSDLDGTKEERKFPLPKYALKELWDQIDRESSLWTWDKEGERTVGLLTLYLEKKHEGTKWPHVFAREGTSSEDPEVLETVDPSELYKIREALEKYTEYLQSGSGAEGTGELPSLAQGEMDPTVDTEVGRRLATSYFDILTGEELAPNSAWHEVLSFPLPVSVSSDGKGDGEEEALMGRSLTIKIGIDGPLFSGPILPQADIWTHVSTFPALAFVLASKRDTRFTFHIGKKVAIALESGGRDAGPNMYIYHDAQGKRQAKQGVVRIGGDGRVGALIGVVGVRVGGGKVLLVCLRERELVLIRDWM